MRGDGAMAESKDIVRLSFNLYLKNPEHRRVYDILQKKSNKNSYIRDAIIYYNHGLQNDVITQEDLRQILHETMLEVMAPLLGANNGREERNHPMDVDGYKNVF